MATFNQQTAQDYGACILRVALGSMTLAHGLLKVFVFTIPGTVQFFGSIGYPPMIAYLTIFAEIAGGSALLLGVYTRAAALALIPLLIGVTLTHASNGWVFSSPNGGWEFPAFWTVMLIVQVLLGKGKFALPLPKPLQLNPLRVSFN